MSNGTSTSRSVISGLLLLLIGTPNVGAAADVTALIAPLLAAGERGLVGRVEGRAYAEARPGGEAMPYASVRVVLLPHSTALEAELEGIRKASRDSLDAYLEAEPKVAGARLAFERSLIGAGADQLIFGTSTDGKGAFHIQQVPEGAWMLLAWRETSHAKAPPAPKRREADRFKTRPQVLGHTTMTLWWRPVTVRAGGESTVRLHDRNEWMTAVREERRVPDQGPPTPPPTQQGAAPR